MSLVVARSSEERAIHIDEYERDRDGTVHCGSCGGKVIAKRGERKVHHYAHACGESCDPWRTSDGMGPWHKRWQGYASKEHLEVTIVKEGVRHIADIRVPETGLVIEVQHSPMPIEEARAREAFYENMIWIVDATESKECGREAVRLVGRNWGLIVVPRVFWSSLSKPTYIDTRWGLFEPAFWEGRHCIARPVGVEKFFESQFGSALAASVEETSWEYSLDKLDGEDLRMNLRMDVSTRVLYGESYVYSEELRKAGFTWRRPNWRYMTRAEKRAVGERDAELARLAKEKLELDPVYREAQRVREGERAAEAQRVREKGMAEEKRRQEELEARWWQMEKWHEGRKIAASRQTQLMSDAVDALERLMANEKCSEASRKSYAAQLRLARAGELVKQKAESVVYMAQNL